MLSRLVAAQRHLRCMDWGWCVHGVWVGVRAVWVCCNAALTCRDPAANSLYANMQPSQELRDVLERQVHVNVVGERPSAAFIATGEDVATRAEGNVTQPGSIYTVTGKKERHLHAPHRHAVQRRREVAEGAAHD